MLYKCDHCSYCSPRRGDLRRHMNRKNRYNKIKVTTCNSEVLQNVHVESQNVTMDQQNVHPELQNVHAESQNVVEENDTLTRSRCNKVLSRKDSLARHELVCDGYDRKQCKICLKRFSTRRGKWYHTHYVKCSPPS